MGPPPVQPVVQPVVQPIVQPVVQPAAVPTPAPAITVVSSATAPIAAEDTVAPLITRQATTTIAAAQAAKGNVVSDTMALLAYPYWIWLIWLVMSVVLVGACVYTIRQADKDRRRKPRASSDEDSDAPSDVQGKDEEAAELLTGAPPAGLTALPTTVPSGVPLPPSHLIQPQATYQFSETANHSERMKAYPV